ncbi:hypothetical protein CYMTET_27795 [Cymbomonas tetramitiformis]|uniref:Uncharacterized protein n=1 Tax=Cymbomonas tetramitiformis TaxID=36881 RepID=A0AAE0FPP6_9CHLO|nr:hypothetical protein CYMTET_27795 [Cymbomonas tetramitiformis]
MKEAMLNPYEYHPERGLYYHEISEGLLVGTQPRLPHDIDVLQHEAAVTTVLNLQEDRDLEYWGVNIWDLEQRCRELSINLVRSPAKDFDPHSLRKMLPACCAEIDAALENDGRVYVHCTAGLGRSPAAAIAYLYWFRNMELDDAYEHLTSQRPCGPKRDSIRGATYDLMKGGAWETFSELPPHHYATLTVEERAHVQQCVRSCRHN